MSEKKRTLMTSTQKAKVALEAFDVKRGPKTLDPQSNPERLYAKIGQLNMELEWLKKKSGISL